MQTCNLSMNNGPQLFSLGITWFFLHVPRPLGGIPLTIPNRSFFIGNRLN